MAKGAVDRIQEAESVAESIEKKAVFDANRMVKKAELESEKIVAKAKSEIAVSKDKQIAMLSSATGNVLLQVDEKLDIVATSFKEIAKERESESFSYIVGELAK